MASIAKGYKDRKGKFHTDADSASCADVTALFLSKYAEAEGKWPGISKCILEKRNELRSIFDEHDKMVKGANLEGAGR